jgi:hypothetical protein
MGLKNGKKIKNPMDKRAEKKEVNNTLGLSFIRMYSLNGIINFTKPPYITR